MQLIDRRLNPKGKSLANRQRFIRRAKASIREAVQKQLHDGKVTDFIGEKKISIPTKTTQEPRFRLDPKTGEQNWVAPGNKTFTEGDRIKKPQQGDGQGAGKDAAPDGELEDSFEFTLTRDELLDVLFDDLELPNLVKTTLKDTPVVSFRRAGYTTAGSPTGTCGAVQPSSSAFPTGTWGARQPSSAATTLVLTEARGQTRRRK